MNEQMNNQMNTTESNQAVKPAAKASKLSLAVTLACLFSAVMMTVSLFLPAVSYGGRTVTLLDVASGHSEAVGGFWIVAVLCALTIPWAAIPKKWAAIVGTIYTLLPMILCIVQVADLAGNGIKLAVGSIFLVLFPILLFVGLIVKLVLLIKDKKRSRVN